MDDHVKEYLCQWSHIIPVTQVQYITDRNFWDTQKQQNTVLFPLHDVARKSDEDITDHVRQVRNWVGETFDYRPMLTKLERGGLMIAFRLRFPDFDDAVLCKLRWL